MFSSLNSFLRNSCRETHSNHSFKCYLFKQRVPFHPFNIAAVTVVDVVVETRKQIIECDVVKETSGSVGTGECRRSVEGS